MQLTNAQGQKVSLLNDDSIRETKQTVAASYERTRRDSNSSSYHDYEEEKRVTEGRVGSSSLNSTGGGVSVSAKLRTPPTRREAAKHQLPPLSSISSSVRSATATTTLPYHHSPSSSRTSARRPTLNHNAPYSIADSRKSSYSSNLSASDSSCASPPSLHDLPAFSPGATRSAPQLQRNDSGSSSRSLSTPSPMTPTYGFDPLDQNKQVPSLSSGLDPYGRPANGPYFSSTTQMPLADASAFFPLQNHTGLPLDSASVAAAAAFMPVSNASLPIASYPTDLIQPSPQQFNPAIAQQQNAPSPNTAADQAVAAAQLSNGTTDQSQKPRKKYPCPHAQRYGCTDTFTTSGHAARHGKKHTGEKNIHCPTCHKAFTRKDNMKQHERTHRNNRDSVGSAATDGSSSKRGKTTHASSKSVSNTSINTATHDGRSDSAPNSAALLESDLTKPSMLSPTSLDFNAMSMMNGANGFDADLEAGGPSPEADDGQYVMHDIRRPAGTKREFSNGATSQDGEGESPGLDALAMAASGFS